MLIAAYCRVSSLEQAVNSEALNQQVDRVKEAGATIFFTDVESGYQSKQNRPQLNLLLQKVKDKEVDKVIVTRLDRLSRKGKQILSIFDLFNEAGVVLKVLDEPIDLSNAAGKLTAGILAVMAQHHSDQKSEAVKHGWEYLRKTHKAVNPPFGYTLKNDRYIFDHEPFLSLLSSKITLSRKEIAEDLVQAYLTYKTLRLALRYINSKYGIENYSYGVGNRVKNLFRFSPAGYSDWISNPILRGHTCYLKKNNNKRNSPDKWLLIENTHTDILIRDHIWKQIQEQKDINKVVRSYVDNVQKYPLSGLVFCNTCRAACYSLYGGRGKNTPGYNYYYQCKNWRTRSCTNKSLVRMDYLEKAVINILTSESYASINTQLTMGNTNKLSNEKEITTLRNQLAGLEALGYNPALNTAKEDIKKQITLLELSTIKDTEDKELYSYILEVFSSADLFIEQDTNQRMSAYRTLISKIWVENGKLINIDLRI